MPKLPAIPSAAAAAAALATGEEEEGTLKITANCSAAIRQLRHPTEQRTLWIDSIRIGQTSPDERSSQVVLMSDIYRGADRVIGWLGEKDTPTEQALNLLNKISDLDLVGREIGIPLTEELRMKIWSEYARYG